MADRFIGVRVPAELKERLQGEASEKGVSLSEHLRYYLATEWASATQVTKREQEARWSGAESPVPYETGHDRANKAKVRQAVENEEPYEVKIEPGTVVAEKDQGIEREPWIASTARILMMEKGLSKVAATMQATKEWADAHD